MSPVAASVVVPSYRGAKRLPVLFDALRAQRFAGDWEVIVVLDGLVDDSLDVIDAYTPDLPLRVVCFDENRGRPAALNAGFAAAGGDVLIRCDDDLEPGPSHVADHVLAHRGPVPVGVVGLYRNRFADTAYARAYGHEYDRSVRAGAYSGDLADTRYFWAGNCSVTRATFDLVGPYDEAFRTYGWEDIDWGFRLARTGVRIVLDPRLECVHHAANVDVVTRVSRANQSGAAVAYFDAKHHTRSLPGDGPASGVRARLWRASVAAAARRATAEHIGRWGARVDGALPWMPPSLGRRVVAFVVDVAARAGYLGAVDRVLDARGVTAPEPDRDGRR